MAHKIASPKNQPRFSHATLVRVKLSPKSFQIEPKCFHKIATELYILKNYRIFYWLTNCLNNSTTTNATGLIFSLFNVASAQEVLVYTFWHTAVCTMHSCANQCPPLCPIYLCWQQSVDHDLVVICNGFLCITEIVHSGCLDYRGIYSSSHLRMGPSWGRG